MFPTSCTANEAIQVPINDDLIKSAFEDIDKDIAEKRESPAPATSIGLTVKAGKFCLNCDTLFA